MGHRSGQLDSAEPGGARPQREPADYDTENTQERENRAEYIIELFRRLVSAFTNREGAPAG